MEDLLVTQGRRSGATLIVAVHSIRLGPALGGARMRHYSSRLEAVDDALRLASAMTLKAAAARLDLGGGKGILCTPSQRPPRGEERRAILLDFADAVDSLDGRYITAEDVGTSAADMSVIAERTAHVVGLPLEQGGSGDPSPLTARGVEAATRACCERRLGSPSLDGARICIVGAGHVGTQLARRLAAAGVWLTLSDIDPGRRALAFELGAEWLEPEAAIESSCDVLAPCALGGAIDADRVGRLRCAIVCGSANNQLSDESLAVPLAEREILYAPDFIANAGGLINVYAELHGFPLDAVGRLVDGIGPTMGRVLETAEARSVTPLAAARALADERLRASPPPAPEARTWETRTDERTAVG